MAQNRAKAASPNAKHRERSHSAQVLSVRTAGIYRHQIPDSEVRATDRYLEWQLYQQRTTLPVKYKYEKGPYTAKLDLHPLIRLNMRHSLAVRLAWLTWVIWVSPSTGAQGRRTRTNDEKRHVNIWQIFHEDVKHFEWRKWRLPNVFNFQFKSLKEIINL